MKFYVYIRPLHTIVRPSMTWATSLSGRLKGVHPGNLYVAYGKTYLLTCASNKDSDQSAHQRSLIRNFIVNMKNITKTCLYNFDPLNPTFI